MIWANVPVAASSGSGCTSIKESSFLFRTRSFQVAAICCCHCRKSSPISVILEVWHLVNSAWWRYQLSILPALCGSAESVADVCNTLSQIIRNTSGWASIESGSIGGCSGSAAFLAASIAWRNSSVKLSPGCGWQLPNSARMGCRFCILFCRLEVCIRESKSISMGGPSTSSASTTGIRMHIPEWTSWKSSSCLHPALVHPIRL